MRLLGKLGTTAQKTTAVGSELTGFLHSSDASCHYEYANNGRVDQHTGASIKSNFIVDVTVLRDDFRFD